MFLLQNMKSRLNGFHPLIILLIHNPELAMFDGLLEPPSSNEKGLATLSISYILYKLLIICGNALELLFCWVIDNIRKDLRNKE